MKNRNRWLFIAASIVFFLLFVTFTFVVKKDHLNQFDFNTTVRLQDHIPRKIDTFFSFLSLVGSFEVLTVILGLILLVRRKLKGIIVFALYGSSHLIEIYGKSFMNHPGPPYLFFRYDLDFIFPSSYVQPGSSYPSGHSFRSVFVVMIVCYMLYKSKLAPIYKIAGILAALAITGLILVSRVSLGEHWTTDVVGGTLLAVSFAFLSWLFL